jgi:hypothetical protein
MVVGLFGSLVEHTVTRASEGILGVMVRTLRAATRQSTPSCDTHFYIVRLF